MRRRGEKSRTRIPEREKLSESLKRCTTHYLDWRFSHSDLSVKAFFPIWSWWWRFKFWVRLSCFWLKVPSVNKLDFHFYIWCWGRLMTNSLTSLFFSLFVCDFNWCQSLFILRERIQFSTTKSSLTALTWDNIFYVLPALLLALYSLLRMIRAHSLPHFLPHLNLQHPCMFVFLSQPYRVTRKGELKMRG